MPIQYDLNKVFFYQEALAKGRAEGRVKGKAEGRTEVIESIVTKMISANVPLSTIQAFTDIPMEIIRKLGNMSKSEN